MKFNQVTLHARNELVLPIVRGPETYFLIFKAITDGSTEFYEQHKLPEPPTVQTIKDGHTVTEENTDHPQYQKQIMEHYELYTGWMVVKSLLELCSSKYPERQAIVWDQVNVDDSSTFALWKDELKDAFDLTPAELQRVVDHAVQVNTLSETAVAKARDAFFLMEADKQ